MHAHAMCVETRGGGDRLSWGQGAAGGHRRSFVPVTQTDPATTRSAAGDDPAVRMLGVTKRFGTLTACDRIDFELRRGEIHVVLGENGAGKTTLMSMLYGLLRPDDGQIMVGGDPVEFRSPRAALAAGIGMVHQHFMLIPDFTVAENVVLGSRSPWRLRFSPRAAEREVAEVAERAGFDVDPAAIMRDLPVETQQRVEILKLLHRGARILVLDEPTASLGPAGIERLFSSLRGLARTGHSAVLITHKLGEVTEIADRVTVIRKGRLEGVFTRGSYDERSLAEAMTGRDIPDLPAREGGPGDEVVLRVRGLTVKDGHGVRRVDGVDLDVRAGEIVGVAGVEGNGQRELTEALAGIAGIDEGTVTYDGQDLTGASPNRLHEARVSVIPEDRLHWGLVADLTLAENLALAEVAGGRLRRRGLLDLRGMNARAGELLTQFGVTPPDPKARADALSGGNQQKVVIARELARAPRVLIAAQPTRGLDVGAIEYVHRQLTALRDTGAAILLVTTELDELLALSDRVAVIYRGRFIYEAPVDAVTTDELALALAGTIPPEGRMGAVPVGSPG